VIITVRVKPGSSKGPLVECTSDAENASDAESAPDAAAPALTVYLQQRAVDGQANAALVAIIAKHFGVAKSRVTIVRGHTSKMKTLSVDGVD